MVAILKDQNNRIWKDPSGRILKSAPFNQQVLQNGLSFWSGADPNFMTLVSGKISELYDFRDPSKTGSTYGKMVQATDAERPIYSPNIINVPTGTWLNKTSTGYGYSAFIVIKLNSTSNGNSGLGSMSYSINYIGIPNGIGYGYYTSRQTCYIDGIKYINSDLAPTTTNILKPHIVMALDAVGNGSNLSIGTYSGNDGGGILEFGWYNRVLSESEIVYNINALNAKYNIF